MAFPVEQHNQDLRQAVEILEYPTFVDQATKWLGRPLQLAVAAMPHKLVARAGRITQLCLKQAFRVVLGTMDKDKRFQRARNGMHKTLVVTTGAVGGAFGGLTAAVELPVTTGLMMRSIADIARSKGEDLNDVEARLACLSVLGMDTSTGWSGGEPHTGHARYFDVRAALASAVKEAADYLLTNAVAEEGAPFIVQLLGKIAERFGIQITEKMAAELVPLVGAVTGSTINYLFMDHFQRIAIGHFTVRSLERTYGSEHVRLEYEACLADIQMERLQKKRTGAIFGQAQVETIQAQAVSIQAQTALGQAHDEVAMTVHPFRAKE